MTTNSSWTRAGLSGDQSGPVESRAADGSLKAQTKLEVETLISAAVQKRSADPDWEKFSRMFLARVLAQPGEGRFATIHFRMPSPNQPGDFIFPGQACVSYEEAMQSVRQYHKEEKDVYFCTSLQGEKGEEFRYPRGRFRAKRRRANSAGHKVLFVDIDVGKKDKKANEPIGYQSTEEAFEALETFGQALGIGAKIAVYSGSGGIHAYWPLDRAIPTQEYQPLADAFTSLALSTGLQFDSQCSVNAACILRVPGTYNYKGTPKPVVLLVCEEEDIPVEDMRQALQPHIEAPRQRDKAYEKNELSAGGEPRTIEDVATECPWIAHTLATNGADNKEPLWFLSLQIATFCDDAETVAHRLSSGHCDYDEDQTQAKFERLTRETGVGFPACQKIAAPHCGTCAKFRLWKVAATSITRDFGLEGGAPEHAQHL